MYRRKTYHGQYQIINADKYIGDVNNIIFRSLAERKMMVYLDKTKEVVKWSSEEIVIPYFYDVDQRWHKYYPDFYSEVVNDKGLKKYIIELKPKTETVPPKVKSKYYLEEMKTYVKNQNKWKFAEEFCSKQENLEFIIMAL
jgi:hypothetical protein